MGHRKYALLFAIILGVPALFHFDVLFLGKTFENRAAWYTAASGGLLLQHFDGTGIPSYSFSDPAASYIFNEPVSMLIGQSLSNKKLPFWSSKIGLGTPLVENIQTGILFPLHWAQYLIPDALGLDVTVLLRLFLCFGSFFFYLYSCWNFSLLAATTGAVVYAFTGQLIRLNMHSYNVYAILPFYLYGFHQTLGRGSRGIIFIAMSLALMLFAGFPQAALGAIYFGIFYGAALLFRKRKALTKTFVGHAIGLLLAAPQLIPLFETMRNLPAGYREGMGSDSLPLGTVLFYLLFPNQGEYFNVVHAGWFGPLPLLVCFIGLGLFAKEKYFRFLWIAPLFYLLKTINFPLLSDLVVKLPFISIIHFSRDFASFVWVPFSVFAGFAVSRLSHPGTNRAVLFGALIALSLCSAWALTHIPGDFLDRIARDGLYSILMRKSYAWAMPLFLIYVILIWRGYISRGRTKGGGAGALSGIMVLLFIFCLLPRTKTQRIALHFENFTPLTDVNNQIGSTGRVGFLTPYNYFPSQLSAVFGVGSFRNVDPLLDATYVSYARNLFQDASEPCCTPPSPITPDPITAWRAVGVTHLIGEAKLPANYPKLRAIKAYPSFSLYEVPQALPKAFFNCSSSELGVCGKPVEISRYEDQEILLKTFSDKEEQLVLTDLYHPHWRAFIDGAQAPVTAFRPFRSLRVPPGEHEIRFEYFSPAWRAGVICFFLGLIGLAIVCRHKWGSTTEHS